MRTEFPVEKVHARLSKEVVRDKTVKLDFVVVLYLMSVLDYVSADTLKLAGNYAENCNVTSIKASDINVAINADGVLQELFTPLSILPSTVGSWPVLTPFPFSSCPSPKPDVSQPTHSPCQRWRR